MALFNFTLSIGISNAKQEEEVEIPDAELEGLDAQAREEKIHEEWTEWAWDYIDGACDEIKEE